MISDVLPCTNTTSVQHICITVQNPLKSFPRCVRVNWKIAWNPIIYMKWNELKKIERKKKQADETKQTKTHKTSFMYIHVRGTLPLIKVLWNTFISVWQSVSTTVFVTIPIESIFKLIKSNVALFVWYIFVTINCDSNKTKFCNWPLM